VGLDLSASELARGDYDESVVSPIEVLQPALAEQFDLVVSFQVLEHVVDMRASFDHMHRYLRPGGLLAVQFSGRWSYFAIINRLIPSWLAQWAARAALNFDGPVFPSPYRDCALRDFLPHLSGWTSVEVVPIYFGGAYLGRIRPLQWAYNRFERRVLARFPNLSTHYQVYAIK
jgi:SAM-dependent methyltransferase